MLPGRGKPITCSGVFFAKISATTSLVTHILIIKTTREVIIIIRVSDLRSRDVINTEDGRRLGIIRDIELDTLEGRVKAIILPGSPRLFGILGRRDDLIITWERIKKIGVDVILVDLEGVGDLKWRSHQG